MNDELISTPKVWGID